MYCPWFLAVSVLGFSILQDTPLKTPSEPEEAELRYGDGSVIRAVILQDNLEVMTRYGKLTVPAKEIRHIEFGVHLPPDVEKRVEQAIKDLKFAAIQIEKALEAVGDPFPANFKPNPDFYKDFRDHKHLRRCEIAIDIAIKELKESNAKFGDHKAKAIDALRAAHVQVAKCIKEI